MDGLLVSQIMFTTRQMGFPALNAASIKYHGTDFLPLFEDATDRCYFCYFSFLGLLLVSCVVA